MIPRGEDYGYPMVWVIMILTVLGLIWLFRRRHWI
ncbi:MAG: Loki-CTERM sorting domain-containing protein [Marinobacter sp.]